MKYVNVSRSVIKLRCIGEVTRWLHRGEVLDADAEGCDPVDVSEAVASGFLEPVQKDGAA